VILTSDDLNLTSSSCGKTAVVNGQTVPTATYHWSPDLKPNYVSEYTAGAELGINRDYSVRFELQRKFDRNGSQNYTGNYGYADYTQLTCGDDRGPDGKAGGGDDNPFGRVCAYNVPTSLNSKFNAPTNTYYVPTDQSRHDGNSAYTGYTFTFNKNYSHSWQLVASLNLDMQHSVNNLTVYSPNTDYNRFITYTYQQMTGKDPSVTWHQTYKMSGIYSVPGIPLFVKGFKLSGVQYSATYLAQDGGWYSRSADVKDGRGTTNTITMDPRFGQYPWLQNWDQSLKKKFKLGETKQTLEFTWQLFNSMNANTLRSWSSTDVNSSNYLQTDKVTPLKPNSILVPRIYEWGVAWKF
jgi:hypothetical protein